MTRRNRRTFLETTASTTLSLCLLPNVLRADEDIQSRRTKLKSFLKHSSRPDFGYGFAGMPRGHLTPTFAAIGCYHLLAELPPHADQIANFVRENHPFAIKKLEREMRVFEFQQIAVLQWLGEDVDPFIAIVSQWTQPTVYPKQYEQDANPIFEYEVMAILCRQRLGMNLSDIAPELWDYVLARQRTNGSFNNTPANDGSDGHVVNTWLGLQSILARNPSEKGNANLVKWLKSCHRPEGGFTWQPEPSVAPVQDVYYTQAAVESLSLLGEAPEDRVACVDWLLSLRNHDGGFGPRPGWPSNPTATYRALTTLKLLGSLHRIDDPNPVPPEPPRIVVNDRQKVFTVQIEAHGTGSPLDAVGLARDLKIDLWGAKNAKPEWIARAQQIAEANNVPVTFFAANEEYGTFVRLAGQGTYSHTSDIQAESTEVAGKSLADEKFVSWESFRDQRMGPLRDNGGTIVWQFNENELYTRLHLDDSLDRGGYSAISAFHFGNPDFVNSEPFLAQYQEKIPFVSLIDAHGPEPWWFADQLTGMRTLFLAEAPTFAQFVVALKKRHVVAVRHDASSQFETWWHGAEPTATELIRSRQDEYRWWGDDAAIQRPWGSLTYIQAGDRFEAGGLAHADVLRLRLRWNNTAKGEPKTPQTEFVRLEVDGNQVAMKHHAILKGGKLIDDYYLYELPSAARSDEGVRSNKPQVAAFVKPKGQSDVIKILPLGAS